MAKITISNQGAKVVDFKVNNESPQSVLSILQENYIDWMHACGGKGRCTTCRFNTSEGLSNLAPTTDAENTFIEAGKILKSQRMACQALAIGDIEIEVPEKCKLPGVTYSN